ncbi:MAG: isoprenylcysteine carboxylmethyltransferase family protein [Bacteroidota bacterium]
MKLKIVPPLVMLIFGCLMYLVDRFLPVGEFDFFGRREMGNILLVFGFLIIAIAIFQLKKAKTTTNPLQPGKANQLVMVGIFKYTRNPIYLGMLLFLMALGLRLGNAFNTLLAAGFVYYMNHFQIAYEEEALAQKFGKTYQLYCKAVRRWF